MYFVCITTMYYWHIFNFLNNFLWTHCTFIFCFVLVLLLHGLFQILFLNNVAFLTKDRPHTCLFILCRDLHPWPSPVILTRDLHPWPSPVTFTRDLDPWPWPVILTRDLHPWPWNLYLTYSADACLPAHQHGVLCSEFWSVIVWTGQIDIPMLLQWTCSV